MAELGNLFGYVLISFVIERVINFGINIIKDKSILEKSPINIPLTISIIFGLATSLTAKMDIFTDLGAEFELGILANILTGLVLAGGSNMLADIINFKSIKKEKIQTEIEIDKQEL